eukprot:scaffold5099_cov55-Phaeocystis_antarctica.AAC.1
MPPRLRLAPRPPGSGSALAVDGVCGRAVLRCAAAPMRDDLGHSRVRGRVRVRVRVSLMRDDLAAAREAPQHGGLQ